MKRKNRLKFLSKSILLEEEGLPRMNLWIVLTLTLGIAGFIYWASIFQINETITVKGNFVESQGQVVVVLSVPSDNVLMVRQDQEVHLSLPNGASKEKLRGAVLEVSDMPMTDQSGNTSYPVLVGLSISGAQAEMLSQWDLGRLALSGEIITGSRSIIAYMLGSLWDMTASDTVE